MKTREQFFKIFLLINLSCSLQLAIGQNPTIKKQIIIRGEGDNQKFSNESNETENLKQIPNSIDKFILKSMKHHHIPGLAAAIIKNGKIAWTKGYGYADIEKNIPFTPNTINAEIGSISKTITASAIMKLWEQGLFDLDDPINNYLPFTINNPYYPNIPITFRMLLNHSSSIAENGDVFIYNFDFNNSPTETLGNYVYDILNPAGSLYVDSIYFNNYTPGSQWSYSNFGYVLLGYLVEHPSASRPATSSCCQMKTAGNIFLCCARNNSPCRISTG